MSASAKSSMALSDISPIFPMGVGTKLSKVYFLLYLALNFSIRPAVSTILSLPVKKG